MAVPTAAPLLAPPPPGVTGLTSAEAAERLAADGPNTLVPTRRGGRLATVVRVVSDPMTILLLIAAPTYLAIGETTDAVITLIALVPIAAVGWVLEARAERALEQLRRLTEPVVVVWRDGAHQSISADQLVVGDLLLVHEGDVVPADGELVDGTQLMTDESALTGESAPVAKAVAAAAPDADPLVLAGTTVLSGRGIARVTATGAGTRYGQIGTLVAGIAEQRTPLQRAVGRLVRLLAGVAAVFCVAVMALQLARGEGWGAAVIAGVSLAIAAIPEEFPMVYTLYLALGAWRLARDHALVRRLTGVETLGSTTVICADKTGTLTLGRLDVADLVDLSADAAAVAGGDGRGPAVPDTDTDTDTSTSTSTSTDDAVTDAGRRRVLEAAVLASEPRPFDPLERSLVAEATALGVDVEALHARPLVVDHPFDPGGKYVTHVWRDADDHHVVAAKGSIEGVLRVAAAPAEVRERALAANERLASAGHRVLAVARGELAAPTGTRAGDEAPLELVGLVAFSDPVRPGVADALAACRDAGIRVIVITGDHPATAHAVVEGLGLPHTDEGGADRIATGADLDGLARLGDVRRDVTAGVTAGVPATAGAAGGTAALDDLVARTNVFARTRPEQKHQLVQALRRQGEVVAMTGDGINDAPALREADIGVAMGQRGTEVAREAATLVLLDDNFATIVRAVRDGRRIFDNLRRAFGYLIAFHPPLLLAALLVPLLNQPLLLLPIQLVLLELVVHPTVSLVFEADPPADDLMRRPPRPAGQGLVRADLLRPLALGLTLGLGVVGLYWWALGQWPVEEARGVGFVALLLGQTLLVLTERSPERAVWAGGLRPTRLLVGVVGATLALTVAVVVVPGLRDLLRLAPFPPAGWVVAAAVAAVTTLWSEPLKGWFARR